MFINKVSLTILQNSCYFKITLVFVKYCCNLSKTFQLPANYVPKKASNTATEQLPSEEKNEVKPFRREEKRKLTEEEKKKRLQEMMNNAKWRDDLRDTNIKTYKKKLEAEKDDYVYSEDFMR